MPHETKGSTNKEVILNDEDEERCNRPVEV